MTAKPNTGTPNSSIPNSGTANSGTANSRSANSRSVNSNTVNILLLLALEVFILFISNSKLSGEDDLFWYLSAGRYIVQTGTVPSSDVFGFTTAGADWIPLEWGWDVIIYYIHSSAGYLGLHILSSLLILAFCSLVIYNLVRLKVNFTLISIITVLMMLGIALRLSVKPHLITYLCLMLLVTIIVRYRYLKRGSYKILYFIPLVFLFWVNMHMGVTAGLLLLFLYFSAELAQAVFKNYFKGSDITALSVKELTLLGVIILVSAMAALVNPHGINAFLYAFNVVSLQQLEIIAEWVSPFSDNYLFTFGNFIYYIFIIGLAASARYSYEKKDPVPFIISAAFFIYSISAVRLTVDFILVSAVFTAYCLNYILGAGSQKTRGKESLLQSLEGFNKYVMLCVIVLLTVMIPGNYLYRITGHTRVFGYGIDEKNFPVGMFTFMRENDVTGIGERPFNSYETGGFFVWSFPSKQSFIGSRTISDEAWNNFVSVLNGSPGSEEIIKKTGFDYFVWMVPGLDYSQNPGLLDYGVLSYLFRHADEWKLVYWRDNSFLFVKNEPKFSSLIAGHEYKYLTPFNLYFNKEYLNKGQREDKAAVEGEIKRRLAEDPEGKFTKNLLAYLKQFK